MGNYILYFTILCFSFLIFVFTITFYHRQPKFQALGYTFLIPFYLSIYSFIYLQEIPPIIVINFIELMLVMALFLMLFIKGFQRTILAASIMILVTLIPLSLTLPRYGFNKIIENPQLIQMLLNMTLLINILLLSRRKSKDRNLKYCFIWFLAGTVLQLKGVEGVVGLTAVSIKIAAYYGFYHYFYRRTYIAWESKMKEAEKLKTSLKQSYDEEVKKQLFYMELQQERLVSAAHTDGMTQAYNKSTIIAILEELISIGKEPISLAMVDIDHFKKINDYHGHIIGDNCIKEIVNIIQRNIRRADYIGRYGGDEFIIILPETNINEAKNVAEEIRKKISSYSKQNVTVSIGISSYPQDGKTAVEIISKADEGLYRSKRKGRNIVSHPTLF